MLHPDARGPGRPSPCTLRHPVMTFPHSLCLWPSCCTAWALHAPAGKLTPRSPTTRDLNSNVHHGNEHWFRQYRSPTTSFAPRQPLPRAGAELRGRAFQRATNDISCAPRLAQCSADVQWTTNDISYSRVSRIRPKIPRRWAPGVGTVGAWVGQKAESPRRATLGAPPRGQN